MSGFDGERKSKGLKFLRLVNWDMCEPILRKRALIYWKSKLDHTWTFLILLLFSLINQVICRISMNLSEFYVYYIVYFTCELDVQFTNNNNNNNNLKVTGCLVLTGCIFKTKQDSQLQFSPFNSVYFWLVINSLYLILNFVFVINIARW